MSKSISLVVNARLNSSRLRYKMVKPFANTTLVDIALEKLNSLSHGRRFDKSCFAVYDQLLADMCVNTYKNVHIIKRDEDEVSRGIVDIKTRFKYFKHIDSDYIMLLNPCCPLISEGTILSVCDYFLENDYNSYTSVVKTRDWIFDMDSNSITRDDPSNVATNKGIYFYKATHAIHIISKKYFIDTGNIWTFGKDDPHCVVVPEEESYDIDTEEDFKMAESAYIWSKR